MSAPREAEDRSRRIPALGLVLLALAVLALYARTATHPFVAYDDPVYVSDNPVVAQGLTLEGLRWACGFRAGNWHPLTWLSHMLDVQAFGLEPGPHHLANAGLHALNALLLACLLARLGLSGGGALLAAALFALHPLRVESVAWASERKDVLAGTLGLATLLAYERYARAGGAARYLAVLGLFALGLLAKSMLVTLPLLFLALDSWPLARLGARWVLLEKLPLYALALGVGLATLWIQQHEGAVGTLQSLTPLERLANAARSYWVYVGQTLWPVDLACFVPHPVAIAPRDELLGRLFLPGLLAAGGLCACTALAWRLRERRPELWVGWVWYLLTAAPVIGLVQVGQQAHADRYTYLPTIGIVWLLVATCEAWSGGGGAARRVLAALGVAAILALWPLAWIQVGTWRDSRTLFTHALAVTERNYLAATFLGMVERRNGKLDAAREHLARALEFNKHHVPAMLELGLTLGEQGDLVGARRYLKQTLRNDPGNGNAERALRRVEARIAGERP